MRKVKRLIAAGASTPTAIRESLGMTVIGFADKHGQPRSTTSEVINGRRAPTAGILAALVQELGGTEEEWRMLLWEAAKPAVA